MNVSADKAGIPSCYAHLNREQPYFMTCVAVCLPACTPCIPNAATLYARGEEGRQEALIAKQIAMQGHGARFKPIFFVLSAEIHGRREVSMTCSEIRRGVDLVVQGA